MVLPSLLEPLVRIPYLISVASLCVQDVASRSVNPHVHPIIQFSLKESNVSGAVKLNFQDSRVGVGRTDNGARLVIVNRDPTPLDDIADLVIHDEIGPTLTAAMRDLN